jgi:leucyl aminopeptidase
MQIDVVRGDPRSVASDALALLLPQSNELPRALRALDAALHGALGKALERGDFAGKAGEVAPLHADGIAAGRVLLVGLGKQVDLEALRRGAGAAVRATVARKGQSVTLVTPGLRRPAPEPAAQALAEGAILGGYRFDRYRTTGERPAPLERCALLAPDARALAALRRGARAGVVIAESTNFARDLSNEPGSVHTPAWLGERAKELGREVGLSVRVLDERELEQRKMGALLAVGRGSAHPPRLIVVEHNAPKRGQRKRPCVALVGKGITFDTGGISIKAAASMEEMKHDMSGGAAVLGALRAAALLKLPLHVVGIVPAAQNSPSGTAYLPGDVIRSASGKTIEVQNTDAEGRIVLADGLHHAQSFEPAAIVDIATLTGACVVALGREFAALISTDEDLAERIAAAAEPTRERVWRMPLVEEHKKAIESHIADVKNTAGREAGTLTAAAFLSHFAGERPWAHLDIAGKELVGKDSSYCVKGATGFGVRLFVELLRRWR